MSQDSQEIKTIEQWKWSEMQGLELLVSSSPPLSSSSSSPYKANPIPTPPPPQREEEDEEQQKRQQQQQEEEAKTTMESSADQENRDSNGGGGGGGGGSGGSSSGNSNGGEKSEGIAPVGFGELFRFADGLDHVLMAIGSLGAIVHGCSLPLFLRFFADLVNSFGSNANNVDKMMQEVLKVRCFHLDFPTNSPKFCFFIALFSFFQLFSVNLSVLNQTQMAETKSQLLIALFLQFSCFSFSGNFAVRILLSRRWSCDMGVFMGWSVSF